MSGSLTVIGGHSSTHGLTGLVTVSSGFTGAVVTSLQALLTSASGAVAGNVANFQNLNVAGESGGQNATVGTFATGILDITNYNSVNATVPGAANISLTVPTGYNTLVVQAPGGETIAGSGASNFLGVFGANSSVNFITNGGSGSIFASGHDDTFLFGTGWDFVGSPYGFNTVTGNANNSSIAVAGTGADTSGGINGEASNIIGVDAQNVSVNAGGSNDLVVVYGNTANVSVSGSGHVLVDGGAATVSAVAGNGSVQVAFDTNGGLLDFINNSTTSASLFGAVAGAVGGNATVFGGVGGGYFQGGVGGNNSLVGGSGSVTLIAAGDNNYLKGAGANNNYYAGGGSTTMVGATGSKNNIFSGGTGSLVVSTSGSGSQSFFVGSGGQELLSGSTVSGAVNSYYFQQDSTGSGSDIIMNFRHGTDHIYINPFGNASTEGVSIAEVVSIKSSTSHPSGGSLIFLSNNTTITLYGVNASGLQSVVGGTTV